MKKLNLLIAVFLCVSIHAQKSFYKGALITELRTGFEVLNTTAYISQKSGNRTIDTAFTDKAVNSYFGIGAEYGLHKNFGVGIGYNNHKFVTSKDSVTGKKEDIRSNDFLATLNFHPVVSSKYDLILGADIGYSTFKFKTYDIDNTVLKGKGMYMSFYFNPRIYFGNFGINFKLSSPFMNYTNVTTNNENFNKNNTYKNLKFAAAWGLGFGIQYRFLKDKEQETKSKAQT